MSKSQAINLRVPPEIKKLIKIRAKEAHLSLSEYTLAIIQKFISELCVECNGSGWIPCEHCSGSGTIKVNGKVKG